MANRHRPMCVVLVVRVWRAWSTTIPQSSALQYVAIKNQMFSELIVWYVWLIWSIFEAYLKHIWSIFEACWNTAEVCDFLVKQGAFIAIVQKGQKTWRNWSKATWRDWTALHMAARHNKEQVPRRSRRDLKGPQNSCGILRAACFIIFIQEHQQFKDF